MKENFNWKKHVEGLMDSAWLDEEGIPELVKIAASWYENHDDKKVALWEYFGYSGGDIIKDIDDLEIPDEDTIRINGEDLRILTEKEADWVFRKYAENYVEDILEEIPQHLRRYFDDEKYIQDMEMDGRGYFLASYDSEEYYSIPERPYEYEEAIYIYRC